MFSDTGRFDPRALAVLRKSFVEMKTLAEEPRHGQALHRGVCRPIDGRSHDVRHRGDPDQGVAHQFGEAGDARHVQALRDTSLDIARGELLV